jgi:hypothetical protein
MNNYYRDMLKSWQVKLSGPKPADELFNVAHALGCRPGVQALHIAMCLRPEGCTVTQFMAAGSCGPAHNKRRELVGKRWLTVAVQGKPYAYVAKLTAKGEAKVAAANAAASEGDAPKAKAKRKAKKAKAHNEPTVTAGAVQPVEATPTPAVTENASVTA